MASYEGHATKRLRTENDGRGITSAQSDNYEDPHKPSPSPVIHVRGLSERVIENDLIEALQHFGTIGYVIMMPRKRQALVEFDDINGAISLIKYAQTSQIYVQGMPAFFNYSTSQKIQRSGGPDDPKAANKVLLITVLNPQYPITVDVLHTICSPNGQVLRIVIFKKNGVQAMVEFDSIESAQRAKQALNGADIYSGCCTLKMEFAKPTTLNVYKNDSESWDYTNPNPGANIPQAPKSKPLLETPKGYGLAPQPYRSGGPGAPPPPPAASNYGMEGDGYDYWGGGYGGYGNQQYGGQGGRYGQVNSWDPYGRAPLQPTPYGRGGSDGYGQQGYGQQGPPGANVPVQGAVMMVYGLNSEKMNCDRIFNLFCLYGNVVRVKFLKSKDGAAMVQMGDASTVSSAIQNLNNTFFFENKLQLGYSKQAFLQDVPNPHDLPDGTPSFKDYMGNRNNRFTNPEAASKNRITPPAKVLHYYNAPPHITETEIKETIAAAGAKPPMRVKQFPAKSERSSTGLIEFEAKADAIEALVCANHAEIPNPNGKHPYVFKLCFSQTPILE
ncbi:heterogeneous nuclear ribonucleoprotein L isoform X2 [Lingula anatina]|uniref:Heterogeneous nuclear ribonucleoprotein L isoform X2 n=1 Tax=Lingula anatina TaxID=7574 RepID=A0A1S3H1T0_LINAN|nr:heterogeneous nuclear ribonucleoprotein L isoform X2 [Lingula anatina]|eukprot:XP_013379094.1 heterogeneous nuclear ribonucleoprotein L isoform X2 [Lingula anatina]